MSSNCKKQNVCYIRILQCSDGVLCADIMINESRFLSKKHIMVERCNWPLLLGLLLVSLFLPLAYSADWYCAPYDGSAPLCNMTGNPRSIVVPIII